jgi:hypothetical protein
MQNKGLLSNGPIMSILNIPTFNTRISYIARKYFRKNQRLTIKKIEESITYVLIFQYFNYSPPPRIILEIECCAFYICLELELGINSNMHSLLMI